MRQLKPIYRWNFMVAPFLGLLLFVVLFMLIEEKLIYFPAKYPDGFWQPERFGLDVEDHYFDSEERTRLHAWFAPSKKGSATLLYCHGNGGNLTYAVEHVKRLVRLGLNVFIFDYRGYGRSQGKPEEAGLYRDAAAAYQYLLDSGRAHPLQLIIYGHSLGGVVAVHLAAQRKCAGVILESTFTNARDMVRLTFPWLPLQWIIKSRLDAASHIAGIHAPLLIFHGKRDRTIPIQLGRRLFELAEEPKFFCELAQGDHNDGFLAEDRYYLQKLEEFIFSLSLPLAGLERSATRSQGEHKDEN